MTVPLAPNANNHTLGRGAVYFSRHPDSGTWDKSFFHLGNVDQFEISIATQRALLRSSMDRKSGLLNSVVREVTHSVTLRGYDYAPRNLALALLGDTTAYTQAGTAVTGETLTTSVVLGAVYRTARRNIGTVTVKKAPSTALVLNTDYTIVDAEAGLIQILSTGTTLVAGDTVLIDYTPTAISTGRSVVRGGSVTQIAGSFLFQGANLSGPNYEALLYRVTIEPSAALALISQDFGSWSLTGQIFDDTPGAWGGSAASPFYTLTHKGT